MIDKRTSKNKKPFSRLPVLLLAVSVSHLFQQVEGLRIRPAMSQLEQMMNLNTHIFAQDDEEPVDTEMTDGDLLLEFVNDSKDEPVSFTSDKAAVAVLSEQDADKDTEKAIVDAG